MANPKTLREDHAKILEASIRYGQSKPKSICTCGHHGDGNASWHLGSGPARGHGRCIHAGCSCEKFTWRGWTPSYQEFLEKTQF